VSFQLPLVIKARLGRVQNVGVDVVKVPPRIAACIDERLLESDWARLTPAALPDLPYLRREFTI
jgi:hypothetical protein